MLQTTGNALIHPQHSRHKYGLSAETEAPSFVRSKSESGPSSTSNLLQNIRSGLTPQKHSVSHHKGGNRASPSAQEATSLVQSRFVNCARPSAQEAPSLVGYKSKLTRSFSRPEQYKDGSSASPSATYEAPNFVRSTSESGPSSTNNLLQNIRSGLTPPQHSVSHHKRGNRARPSAQEAASLVNSRFVNCVRPSAQEAPSLAGYKSKSTRSFSSGSSASPSATNEAPSFVRSPSAFVRTPASEANRSFSRLQRLKSHESSLPHLNSSEARLRIIDDEQKWNMTMVKPRKSDSDAKKQSRSMLHDNRRTSHTVSSGAAFYSKVIARQVAKAAEQVAKRAEMERFRNEPPKKSTSESPDSAASTIFASLLRFLILGFQMCMRPMTALTQPIHVTSKVPCTCANGRLWYSFFLFSFYHMSINLSQFYSYRMFLDSIRVSYYVSILYVLIFRVTIL